MALFAVAGAYLLAEREREVFERGAIERVRALLTAVDAELRGSVTTLEAMAGLPDLDAPDIETFRPGALRILATQPDWINTQRRQIASLRVADMNGDRLPDLVVGCFNSNSFPPYDDWRNFIHFNTGSGLEPLPTWISADQVHTNDVQVADINGDTFPDVFSANGGFAHSPSTCWQPMARSSRRNSRSPCPMNVSSLATCRTFAWASFCPAC